MINPKDVVPPKTNIANIGAENDKFLNKCKLIIGWFVFSSHTINKQKTIINNKKFPYTDILKIEWEDQDVKLINKQNTDINSKKFPRISKWIDALFCSLVYFFKAKILLIL